VILSAEDDYFHLRRQRAFEALRQGHSGKTASNYHKSFDIFRHDDLAAVYPAFTLESWDAAALSIIQCSVPLRGLTRWT